MKTFTIDKDHQKNVKEILKILKKLNKKGDIVSMDITNTNIERYEMGTDYARGVDKITIEMNVTWGVEL